MNRIAHAALAIGLAASAATATPLAASAADSMPAPTLTVAGNGSITRTPDQAVVRLEIETNDDVAARATSANNAAYAKLAGALHALGLADADIKTAGYNLNYMPRPPQLPQPPPPYPPRYGYTVDRSIDVTTGRTDQAGAIIDAAVRSGVTSIGGVSFGVRDQRAAQRQALAAAVADAESQARALADAAHVRLGRILRIAPPSIGPVTRPVLFQARMAAAPVPTEIQPGDLTVTATVNITYAIASP